MTDLFGAQMEQNISRCQAQQQTTDRQQGRIPKGLDIHGWLKSRRSKGWLRIDKGVMDVSRGWN